jgi:ABC-2 type transport system permease protein
MDTKLPIRVVEPSSRAAGRARDLLRYRELLWNLVRKELSVKYTNSLLGLLWSLVNPAMYLVIFWIAFVVFLGVNIPYFPIYLLSGLLAFNLWSSALGGAVGSLIGNAPLVTKVYFPREILPLSSIGAALMHFFFQLLVLVSALVVMHYLPGVDFTLSRAGLVLVPSALVVLVLLMVGFCLIVSVLNVYFRDVAHVLELALLAWFWMTPIVYTIAFVHARVNDLVFQIFMLNPMTPIVLAFQRGLYGLTGQTGAEATIIEGAGRPIPEGDVLITISTWWYMRNLAILAVAAMVLIGIGWTLFGRLESRIAEEL